jgi:type IV fimbrial biogenesis protein FimT
MSMLRKNDGFSLHELMVIMGIMAIMCAIAIPSVIGWLPKYRMSSAARELLGAMEFARQNAVRQNAVVVVNFNYADETYNATIGGAALRTWKMPPGVDLKQPSSQALGASVRYNNQGMPVDASGNAVSGKVAIGGGGPDKVVSLSAGGSIRIEK